MEVKGEIIFYQTANHQIEIGVMFQHDTVWLSQKQMSDLFQKDSDTIGLHLKHIFQEHELEEEATTELFSVVQQEGKRKVNRRIKYYNLDAILSVGYRVNSKRGTQFRQWTTQRLKEHLVQGYSINQQRLEQLQQTIQLIYQSGQAAPLQLTDAKGLLDIISRYTQSFVLLNQFDNGTLPEDAVTDNITYQIRYTDSLTAIEELKKKLIEKKEASSLFGNQREDSFEGILNSIVQTFDGVYLYPSIEEQAAHLLYFIIKNHPFTDGNKRIGAFLFIWFLEKNKHRFKENGETKINDNGLTALALLVAQSNPSDKEIMIRLIINLINSR